MLDKFHDECGVVGVWGHTDAAKLAYLQLFALQHRGQEGCGVVSVDNDSMYQHRGLGLVSRVFDDERLFDELPGHAAIAHNRYSTSGHEPSKRNLQPLATEWQGGLAIACNGHTVNAADLRQQLETNGALFESRSDTEVFLHLIARAKGASLEQRVIDALQQAQGAYSLVVLTPEKMIVARDPRGIRPLVLGRFDDATVVASETCAFDLIDAHYEREIAPGEVLVVSKEKKYSIQLPVAPRASCVFEYIYFSRPDSRASEAPLTDVGQIRKALGRELAKEQPAPHADIVIAVPDSGLPAALGYAEASGIPFELGLTRNHYIGRTFIEPEDGIRHFGVKVKLNARSEVLRGKSVVVIDDSIVRGTTSKKIVEMLRRAGASEVHMRISAPPTRSSCHYGVDTPKSEDLIAGQMDLKGLCEFITADSIGYLSEAGMWRAVPGKSGEYCAACFNGNYPVSIPDNHGTPRRIVRRTRQRI